MRGAHWLAINPEDLFSAHDNPAAAGSIVFVGDYKSPLLGVREAHWEGLGSTRRRPWLDQLRIVEDEDEIRARRPRYNDGVGVGIGTDCRL